MDQRDRDINSVGDALKKMMQEFSIERKYDQMDLIASWRKIVGDPIANRTEKLFIKEDTLFVVLTSAALKHELNMTKSIILEKIENELGHATVKNIRFL